MAAIVGRGSVMEAAQSTFISSSYWTEAVGPAAALATIQKMQQTDVPSHVDRIWRWLLGRGRYHCFLCRRTQWSALTC